MTFSFSTLDCVAGVHPARWRLSSPSSYFVEKALSTREWSHRSRSHRQTILKLMPWYRCSCCSCSNVDSWWCLQRDRGKSPGRTACCCSNHVTSQHHYQSWTDCMKPGYNTRWKYKIKMYTFFFSSKFHSSIWDLVNWKKMILRNLIRRGKKSPTFNQSESRIGLAFSCGDVIIIYEEFYVSYMHVYEKITNTDCYNLIFSVLKRFWLICFVLLPLLCNYNIVTVISC